MARPGPKAKPPNPPALAANPLKNPEKKVVFFASQAVFGVHKGPGSVYNRRSFGESSPEPKFQTIWKGGETVQVTVRDNNVDQALKVLKKKLQREGVFREMKLRRAFEKPSQKRAREKAEAVSRARKLERKRLEREGF